MNLSFDGQKLLVVTGVPHYQISVWNVETGEQLKGEKSTIPLRSGFINAQFSPFKENFFGVLYENTFQLCEINPAYENSEQQEPLGEESLELNIRINQQSMQNNGQQKFTTFIWDEQNNVSRRLSACVQPMSPAWPQRHCASSSLIPLTTAPPPRYNDNRYTW